MEIDTKFLKATPAHMANFVLELTDKCNLRCVYCHQNRPDFEPTRFMSEQMVAHVMEYFRHTKPPYINLTGGGDLIMAPGWAGQCTRMLDSGIPLRATVNLGKVLTPEEAEVFARFQMLTISIDTVDQQALKQYRKAVDIRTITYNIMQIKTASRRLRITEPEWIISAVYYAEITAGLADVAAYAASLNASMFGLQDLLEYDNIANNVTPVWKLQGDAAHKAIRDTRAAIAFAEAHGMTLSLPGDFLPRLDQFEKECSHALAA